MTTQRQQGQANVVPDNDVWFLLEIGGKMCMAQLVRLGPVYSLAQARQGVDKMSCRFAGIQAARPFKDQFPFYDGRGSVVLGDPEWRNPNGDVYATCLGGFGTEWSQSTHWVGSDVSGDCRWLVVSE